VKSRNDKFPTNPNTINKPRQSMDTCQEDKVDIQTVHPTTRPANIIRRRFDEELFQICLTIFRIQPLSDRMLDKNKIGQMPVNYQPSDSYWCFPRMRNTLILNTKTYNTKIKALI
jgi:hypothetical protein